MEIVCVIVNYNDVNNTLAQIDRIKNYKNLDRIIVVDNASTDDSFIRLKNYKLDNLIFLSAKKNGGYGYGNNIGIRYAKKIGARYAIIANPDTEFTEEAVNKLHENFLMDSKLAAIAPFMYTPKAIDKVNTIGSKENILNGATAWPLRSWLADLLESGPISRRIFYRHLHYKREYLISSDKVYVDTLVGAFLMVDIEKFLKVGGYDENVFLYAEENILASKLKKNNYKSALLSKERYIHRHSESIKKSFTSLIRRQRLREKSTLYYYKKYLKIGKLKYLISKLFFKAIELEIFIFNFIFREKL